MRDFDVSASGLLTIDVAAMLDNYGLLRRMAGAAEVASVVKADAYGLGAARLAPALAAAGCKTFFVANVNEAVALRPLLPNARLLVLEGADAAQGRLFRQHGLIPVLSSTAQISDWIGGGGGDAALHVDTGMNRLGLPMAELASAAELKPVLVMSHLACSDDPGHAMNAQQLDRFAGISAAFPGIPASLANSGGILLGGPYLADLARPGIALYGGNPANGNNPFREVVHLQGKILQLREVAPPESCGYGATWTAPVARRLATVGVGYADGYPRRLSNAGFGVIDGVPAPIAGRVSMDLTVFDVTDCPGAMVGGWVSLVGGGAPLERVAELAGTAHYEILTGMGARYHRIYRGA